MLTRTTCDAIQKEWMRSFDAGEAEPAAVAAHRASCPDCQTFARVAERLGEEIRRLPAPEPDLLADRELLVALQGKARSRPRAMTPVVWPVLAAGAGCLAALLLAALGLGLARRVGDQPVGKGGERNGVVVVSPSPQPPPRRGEGELGPSLSRARAGNHNGYGSAGVRSGSISPLRFGEGVGEGAAAAGDHRHPPARSGSELAELSGNTGMPPRWPSLSPSDQDALERQVRHHVPVRDDFVRVPFPRLASASDRQIAEAVESYKREAAGVDPRLAHEVTLQQKATALSDLCERLRGETGIQLAAGQSVADEKVTLFCEKVPLREVMRQLSRPFGYTWLRSGKEGEYRYELVQDLRSQLLEEELRNRDRTEALMALERDIDRYRPYLGLSPDEALAREKSARPEDKRLFERLGREGWGLIHMYYRLSRQDMDALRAGQMLTFSMAPSPGERPLPPDLDRSVLQSVRGWRVIKFDNGFGRTEDPTDPRSQAPTAFPEVHAQLFLGMSQSELGQFTFWGNSGFFTPRNLQSACTIFNASYDGPIAIGRSPAALKPENGAAHAGLAHEPALRGRVTLQPQPSCRPIPPPDAREGSIPEPKVTTADVLEVLHKATGLPIVSDHYTRLYKPEAVSVRNLVLFDALNHLSDAMRLRWNKDAGWLQFRSASYYHDRLKEVPNRLLARWSAARQKQGMLTLDDVVEIAQLPDAQLNGAEMAEGAENCFGLAEWQLLRDVPLRSHVRFLAQFTPEQRQEMMSAAGLPFTRMSLAQQQGFIARALGSGGDGLQSLEEMARAVLRVDYTHPGWFQWREVGEVNARRWVVPIEPGRQGRRVLLPPVRERTREAALQTARRVYPHLSEARVEEERRYDPQFDPAQVIREADIHPTGLDLVVIYVPGLSNARAIRWFRVNQQLAGG